MPVEVDYTPAAAQALYDSFTGQIFTDAQDYSSHSKYHSRAKYLHYPVQNEILNLIDKNLSGIDAFKVRNETGATLFAGTVISITGYSAAQDRFLVAKADADDASLPAHGILTSNLNNVTNGIAWRNTTINFSDTASASVGDEVYLSATAGGYVYTAPTGATQYAQVIGFVRTVDGVSGEIAFHFGMPGEMERISESMLPSSVPTLSGLFDNMLLRANGTADIQGSDIYIDDAENVTGVNALTMTGALTANTGIIQYGLTVNDSLFSGGDFLVKGQTISHAAFVDVSTGRSHFGYNTPPTGTRTVNINGDLSGTTLDGTILQAVNTGGSPYVKAETDTTAGQDPYFLWNIQSTLQYALGIDNSDSDKLKLTTHATAATPSAGTTIFESDSSGNTVFYQTVEVTPSAANYDTLTVNHSDGTPRVQIGNLEASTTFGGVYLGNITPSGTNFSLIGDGASTTLRAPSGDIKLVSGTEALRVSTSEVVINEPAITHDFRIEGTSLTHGFFYDASTGRVHIGYNAPPTGSREVNVAGRINFAPTADYEEIIRWNTATGAIRGALGVISTATGNGGLWLGGYAPTATNYTMLGNASTFQTKINGPGASGTIRFLINNSEKAMFDSSGNLLHGTTTSPTGTNGKCLIFGDNAGDPTPGTNTAGTYGKDVAGTVEMFVIDEAANVTQTSPHDEEGFWYYHSKNLKTGREIKVHLEKFFQWVTKKFPETQKFFEENFAHDPKEYKKKTKRTKVAA